MFRDWGDEKIKIGNNKSEWEEKTTGNKVVAITVVIVETCEEMSPMI